MILEFDAGAEELHRWSRTAALGQSIYAVIAPAACAAQAHSIMTTVAEGLAGADASSVRHRGSSSRSIHALVVDDCRDVAEMLSKTLALEGMRGVIAVDPEEAIRLAKEGGVDIALVELSVETGDERLIEPLVLLGVPVVVFTCAAQAEREAALARGAELVLRKPHDVLSIGDSMAAVLQKLRATPIPLSSSR
jgi:CheY-like chemotaxis protein